jgi:hypothetical protein
MAESMRRRIIASVIFYIVSFAIIIVIFQVFPNLSPLNNTLIYSIIIGLIMTSFLTYLFHRFIYIIDKNS